MSSRLKSVALIVIFALFLSLFLSTSHSAQKITSGASCKGPNKKVDYKDKTFTCIKKGNKYVWSKGVAKKNALPTPSATPTPTPTSASLEFEDVGVKAIGESTAELTFRARGYLSYRVFVVLVGDSNRREISRTAVINFSERTAKLNLSGLECGRSNYYEVNVVIFSGKDGAGSSLSSGVKVESTGACGGQPPTPTPSPAPSSRPTNPADNIHRQSCTRENDRIRNTVNEFLCRKDSEGRLIWMENYRFYNPNPMPKLPQITYETNQYFEPKMPSAPVGACKIQENSDQGAKRGDVASGFPFMPRFASYPKNVTMALIPIDFADLEGDQNFKSRIKQDMEYTSDWYRDVSGGRLTIEWKVSDNWIRLPGLSKDYFVEFSGKYPDTINFWNKVLPVVDAKFDLTGVETINFLLPPNQKIAYESVQSFSFLSEMKQVNSTKTKILSFALGGEVFEAPDANLWSYWAHEFGHEIGWAHVGSSRGQEEPMNGLDLMGNQNGPYRDLSGWLRFIIGWLADNQVYCQETSGFVTNDVSLIPLNESKDGIKLVVIPTGTESAIVIESRRPTKYACPIENLPGGVLVTTYDARLGNQSYFLKAHYPSGRQPSIRCEVGSVIPDVLLHTGDTVQVGEYKISVISSGNVDQIRITKG